MNNAPNRFPISPKHHSTRKKIDRPDVLPRLQFLYICGSCAKSQATILSVPRTFDVNASGVGTQVWKVLLKRRRKSFVGSQCAGRDGSKASGESHGMVVRL